MPALPDTKAEPLVTSCFASSEETTVRSLAKMSAKNCSAPTAAAELNCDLV
jgi:hypothetical protein